MGGSHQVGELGQAAPVETRVLICGVGVRSRLSFSVRADSRPSRGLCPRLHSLPVSSRVKLVPLVLVVLKALKVLVVNLALLGPLGLLVPL